MKYCLALVVLIGALLMVRFPAHAVSPCELNGAITSNSVLNPTVCPVYTALGTITVSQGITLTIRPGTVIQFIKNTASPVQFNVEGELVAQGSVANPIRLTSASTSPAKGDWQGISFLGSSINAIVDTQGNYVSGTILQHVIVEYAGTSTGGYTDGAVNVIGAAPYLDYLQIHHNLGAAISVSERFMAANETIYVRNSTATDNGDGACIIYVSNQGKTYLLDNVVTSNQGTGLCINDGDAYILRNQSTYNERWGIDGRGDRNVINGNIVTGNLAGGITLHDGSATISHNLIQDNQGVKGAGLSVFSPPLSSGPIAIVHNQIVDNTATMQAGGLHIDCTFHPLYVSGNTIRGNVVPGTVGKGGGISIAPYCDNENFHIQMNDILDNQAALGSGLYNANPNIARPIDAIRNWWGTTDPTLIENMIFHQFDDPNRGLVLFQPFLTGSQAELPRVYLPLTTR